LRHAQGIDAVIKFHNRISAWVASEIVSTAHARTRVVTLMQFVRIAMACLELRNYSAVFALASAWQKTAVSRLKMTWAAMPKKLM
jgi:son of sevenless-like protein